MRKAFLLVLTIACVALAANSASAAPGAKPPPAHASDAAAINLASRAATIELREALSPYHGASDEQSGQSSWYITQVANGTEHAVTRVVLAGQPADAALRVFPRSTRAQIRQLTSSDDEISIARAPAFGRYAYRVTIPPRTTAPVALRVTNADDPPSVLAWSEAALIVYHHRLAIFIAAVAGLIAAAAAISGGVAAMTGHAAPRWAALVLVGIFAVWLATTGFFDAGWGTAVGGPYGFLGMALGLSLAAAVLLVEEVAPLSDQWPWAEKYRRMGLAVIVVLSALAFVGVPATALLINILVVFGAAVLAVHLVRRGMAGARTARVLAPSATVFALVSLAAAFSVIGGFHGNPIAGEIIGGFAAAGAVLLALAIAAGEGIGLMEPRRLAASARVPPARKEREAPRPAPEPAQRDGASEQPPPAGLAAIGASHQGIYDLDFQTDILHLSKEAAVLIGFQNGSQAIPHASWVARVHADDQAIYNDALRDYCNHPGLAFRIEFRVKSESGRYPWFELRATMIGEGERADRCLGLMADITTRKEAEAAIIDRTLRDPLTGIGNRVALMEELDRLGPRPWDVVFAILDIDRFKSIHASLGDAGADAVLRDVSERLAARFGNSAEVFRVGGDSFALLFAKGGGATAIGAELVELGGAPLDQDGRTIFAPVSVGVATGAEAEEPLDLLRNAEVALRQAKRQGGGCARVYSPELDSAAPNDAVALEAELRRALDEGQFDLFYQPIIRLSDRSVAGFEALLRWHHPERGLVWPADFVGHAEETGLIVEMGRFALTRAAEDLARWQRFFPIDPPLFVSVNVSRRQLQDSAFERSLADVLEKSGTVQGSLRLEVTESAIAASENAEERLARLHAMGAGLAIDDFGTGMSSLSQLKSIPFDIVKIDKSFLSHGGETSGEGEVILGSIVALAHELKRAIVVEGVESEEDAVRMAGMGCEFAQGFHFSVPLPAQETLNYIALHYAPAKHGAAAGEDDPRGAIPGGGGSGATGV